MTVLHNMAAPRTAHTHTPRTRTRALNPITTYNKDIQADTLDPLSAGSGDGDSEKLGRLPYFLNPQVMADRAERESQGITPADYGKRWRATFRGITGNAPLCMPADHDTAKQYLHRVQAAIRRGGWSPSEWGSLSRAEKVWLRRANGLDARFEVVGTRPGRLQFDEREKMRAIQVSRTLAAEVNAKPAMRYDMRRREVRRG